MLRNPYVQQERPPPRLTGPLDLQGLFLLLTQEADSSRPDYTAPSCPNSCDLGTAEYSGVAPPLTLGVLRTLFVQQESTPQRLTGPSALQGLFLLLSRGADNSRPNYTAPCCPNPHDLGTAE